MKKSDDRVQINKKNEDLEKERAAKDREVADLKIQLEECTNQWKRALADYQNLEKRIDLEKRDFVKFAIKQFVDRLLPVVDDLEKARQHLKDHGLDLALKKLEAVLKGEGIERIETKGREFDVGTMEAITMVEGDTENMVVEEVRPGYTMHGSVLRPAQVVVSKKTQSPKS